MKRAGRAVIFELGDMIGSKNCTTSVAVSDGRGGGRFIDVRAVPLPFYDGVLARLRAAWEIARGRAYPCAWPEPGELERVLVSR